MVRWLAILLASVAAISLPTGKVSAVPAPPGYDDPGPRPTNFLPGIVAHLRTALVDPYSIRDFILCEPRASEAREFRGEWEPARWSVVFALNARNSYGGYAGRERWRAHFTNGQVERLASAQLRSGSALDADLNRLADRLLERCERIPDAEIQRIIQTN